MDHFVFAIAVQADGKILAGGQFTQHRRTVSRNCIARLDATTGLADSFNPNANVQVLSIAVQADRQIFGGGHFFRNRRLGPQFHPPPQCTHRPADTLSAHANTMGTVNCGASGRQDFSRGDFSPHSRLRGDAFAPAGNHRARNQDPYDANHITGDVAAQARIHACYF